jgi:hypothetical protein
LKTSAHKLQISGIRTVAISARIRKARVDFRLTIVTSISGQTSAREVRHKIITKSAVHARKAAARIQLHVTVSTSPTSRTQALVLAWIGLTAKAAV